MSDNQITEVDPLSAAASGVDTSFPCLAPDRIGQFIVKKAAKKTNDKGNVSISLKVAVHEKELAFTDGKPARVGFAFNQNINITPSEKFDIESVKRQMALWMKALGVADKPLSFMRDEPEKLEGLVFQARTGIAKDKNGVYPDSTQLTPILPA